MHAFPWLTILTLLPLLGGVAVVCLGSGQARVARTLSLVSSFAALAMALRRSVPGETQQMSTHRLVHPQVTRSGMLDEGIHNVGRLPRIRRRGIAATVR